MSELDKDFEDIKKMIAANLKSAAELINQANELSKKYGKGSLATDPFSYDIDDEELEKFNLYSEIKPLMKALDNAGWSSSSLGC